MKDFVIRFGDLPTDQAWHVQNLINSLGSRPRPTARRAAAPSMRNAGRTSPARCAAAARPGKNRRQKMRSVSMKAYRSGEF
jgi:enoyl-CoA hydratase/E-phenylitaconyl-CoA hydratase/naphthyl-2-hydroxymethylsuccinyl-CoA hydratase